LIFTGDGAARYELELQPEGDTVIEEGDEVFFLAAKDDIRQFMAEIRREENRTPRGERRGRRGKRLRDAWATGAKAHLGIMVPDFPNFFMLYGPNSIIYMLESQIAHVMRCLKQMDRSKATHVDVADEVYQGPTAGVQRELARTVWASYKSWYVDARGHNVSNWPGSTLTYRWLTRWPTLDAYRFTQQGEA
jgi:hypothetical protein